MRFNRSAVIAVLLALSASAAQANIVNFTGSLTNSDPTYNRVADASNLSIVGTAVSYDVFSFSVDTNGSYDIETTAAAWQFSDTYLSLYASFNPASPLSNLVGFNDDSGVGNLSLLTANLTAATTYYLVVTSFNNASVGEYAGTISGSGLISLDAPASVPEPASLALLGLGLIGIGAVRRRRAAR